MLILSRCAIARSSAALLTVLALSTFASVPQASAGGLFETFFGDSIKGTAEVSYISVGLGMALGFGVGALSIPIPGVTDVPGVNEITGLENDSGL